MTLAVLLNLLRTESLMVPSELRVRSGFFIDSNLLVLLIVGSVGRDIIAKHRRLKEYTVEDYDILIDLLNQADQVFVTPNTLTETSNLLAQHKDPERSQFFETLRLIIQESKETFVVSLEASNNKAFVRLGLTDAALLTAATRETPLVTVDFDLYRAALENGEDTVVNFTHLRNL